MTCFVTKLLYLSKTTPWFNETAIIMLPNTMKATCKENISLATFSCCVKTLWGNYLFPFKPKINANECKVNEEMWSSTTCIPEIIIGSGFSLQEFSDRFCGTFVPLTVVCINVWPKITSTITKQLEHMHTCKKMTNHEPPILWYCYALRFKVKTT